MSTIEKIIGQEKRFECVARVQELVEVWMRDNDVHRWEDILAPNEFNAIDTDYFEDIRTGATKIVLLPKDASYVVKIPYIGEENWSWGGEPHWFNGGDYDNDMFDYCEHEAYLYEQAQIFNCDQFLVPTLYLMDVGNIPIYIQTKVVRSSPYRYSKPSNEDEYRYASIKNSDALWPEVGAILLQYYSESEIATFLMFLKEFKLNDLESSRNGEYIAAFGRYVFWDYSGYNEDND